jgi:NDP-sugar pyrophosphorylase family protein
MSKRAIILAGGKGTRLRPYSISLPKPLVPVGETPVLEIIIKQLVNSGFDHVTISVNHFSDLIKAFFGDGRKWDITIDYTHEDKPLSTMGPLTLVNDLPDNFLVMNGDVITDLDFKRFIESHVKNENLFTIASSLRNDRIDYGVLESNDNGKLTGFHEKPTYDFLVSMGVYSVSKKILQYIPKNEFFGFDNLMLKLIQEQNFANIYKHEGYWLDIGRPNDYEKALQEIDHILKA